MQKIMMKKFGKEILMNEKDNKHYIDVTLK